MIRRRKQSHECVFVKKPLGVLYKKDNRDGFTLLWRETPLEWLYGCKFCTKARVVRNVRYTRNGKVSTGRVEISKEAYSLE